MPTFTDDIIMINPVTHKEVIKISATADGTLFNAMFNNQTLQFFYKDGSTLNLDNYKIDLYNSDGSCQTLLGSEVNIFKTPSGEVIIRDGIIIIEDNNGHSFTLTAKGIDRSYLLKRNYPDDATAKAAGIKRGQEYMTNGVIKIQQLA